MKNNFAVFILTNGRANNVITYKVLRKQGYTGKIYLMVDDEGTATAGQEGRHIAKEEQKN